MAVDKTTVSELASLAGIKISDDELDEVTNRFSSLIEEMDRAEDRRRASVEIAAHIVREIRPMCQGVHIMSIGWEARIPEVLEAAGLSETR